MLHYTNRDTHGDRQMTTYTQDQLKAAFDFVAVSGDWKAPIDSIVADRFVDVTLAAISHFTATVGRVKGHATVGHVRIQAAGYRMGPAGDH